MHSSLPLHSWYLNQRKWYWWQCIFFQDPIRQPRVVTTAAEFLREARKVLQSQIRVFHGFSRSFRCLYVFRIWRSWYLSIWVISSFLGANLSCNIHNKHHDSIPGVDRLWSGFCRQETLKNFRTLSGISWRLGNHTRVKNSRHMAYTSTYWSMTRIIDGDPLFLIDVIFGYFWQLRSFMTE